MIDYFVLLKKLPSCFIMTQKYDLYFFYRLLRLYLFSVYKLILIFVNTYNINYYK